MAHPVSVDSRSSADGVEDDTTNAPQAVAKFERALRHFRLLIALELAIAAQAVEMAKVSRLGHATGRIQAAVRRIMPSLDEDRGFGGDVEAIAAMLADQTIWDRAGSPLES